MKEVFQILLTKLCFLGIGGISVFLFVRATLPSVSRQIVTPVRDAVRKRRVSAIIPIVCACGMIAYAVVKNDASRVGNARSLAPVFRSQEMSLIEPWFLRGGRDTGHILTFDGDWCFPHGTNHLERVEVWGSGAVYPSEKNPTPIAELATKLSLKPHSTEVFMGRTTNNTYRIEWRDAYVSRTSNETIDASIELFRNGDVIVTENGVTTEIPYGIPFEHDGYGQDEAWVRANYDNADEILSVGYANWVDQQIGVGLTNGLYKFTARFEDAPPEPTQLYIGDCSVCVTNAGEYVFVLGKGTEYEFGTWPFNDCVDYWAQDDLDENAELITASCWGGENPGEWTLDGGWSWLYNPSLFQGGYYPGYCCMMPTLRGSPDVACAGADAFPTVFEAILSDYPNGTEGLPFHWSTSDDNVRISTPNAARTEVSVDTMPAWDILDLTVSLMLGDWQFVSSLRSYYGTSETPCVFLKLDVPEVMRACTTGIPSFYEVSVAFDTPTPTNGLLRLSLDSTFTCSISKTADSFAGSNSWCQWELDNQGCGRFTAYIRAESASASYLSEHLVAEWIDPSPFEIDCRIEKAFTIIKQVVDPICNDWYGQDGGTSVVLNPCCAIKGEDNYYRTQIWPEDFPSDKIVWEASSANVLFPGGILGQMIRVVPSGDSDFSLEPVVVGSSERGYGYQIKPIEMTTVAVKVCEVISRGSSPSITRNHVDEMLSGVNRIFRQVGLRFVLVDTPFVIVENTKWNRRALMDKTDRDALASWMSGFDGVKVYFIEGTRGAVSPSEYGMLSPWGLSHKQGVIVQKRVPATTLAHELGHACGLKDIYVNEGGVYLSGTEMTMASYKISQDWGCYPDSVSHVDLVKKLLMYGGGGEARADIPRGYVFGMHAISWAKAQYQKTLVRVGFNGMRDYPPVHR